MKHLLLLPLAVLPVMLQASPTTPVGVRLSLVSEVSSIVPSTPFSVALHVVHEPGFHTYWRHPGIVGVPFMMEWELPEGFSHGEIQWPAPRRVMMFDYPANGYKDDDVLLITDITPPTDVRGADTLVHIKASVRLMACSRSCHPGFYPVSLELPVAKSPSSPPSWHPTWRDEFEKTRAAFPRPLSGWNVTLHGNADSPRIAFDLIPGEGATHNPGEVIFFSHDGQITTLPEPTVTRSQDGVLHIAAPRAEFSPKGCTRLSGVLWASNGWNHGGVPAYATIDIPYPPPPEKNEGN